MAETRPRVALVTTTWSDPWDEVAFVARQVGAALATEADVDVIVADGNRELSEEPDGVFRVIRVPSHRPDRHRAGLLLSALAAGHVAGEDSIGNGGTGYGGTTGVGGAGIGGAGIGATAEVPRGIRAHLRHLGGGSGAVPSLLRSLAPDAVVVAGHRHELATSEVKQWAGCGRIALMALAANAPELGLSLDDGVLDGWDAILATNSSEADLLRASFAARPGPPDRMVHQVGISLDAPVLAGLENLPGRFSWEQPWLVVLDETALRAGQPPRPLKACTPEVAHLALRFPTLTLVVVTTKQVCTVRGRSRSIEGPLDRRTLWKVMAGAVATLDLRPPRTLGREVLESMLIATPVVVPATSAAARGYAEASNGGLWYRDASEMAASVARMMDCRTRDLLGQQGRRWATGVHGDQAAYVAAVCSAVLGP